MYSNCQNAPWRGGMSRDWPPKGAMILPESMMVGPDEPTRVDRPAHIAHRVFGTVADIAQRGEALIQDELCVVHAARRVHDGAGSNRHDLRE